MEEPPSLYIHPKLVYYVTLMIDRGELASLYSDY